MGPGDKVLVKRAGNRSRLSGVVTRIYNNQPTTQVEYRAFSNNCLYLSPITDVRPYDRTITGQKQDKPQRRHYKTPVKDMFDD